MAVTDAYDLDAEYVIHAAAMPHYGDGSATSESIEAATRNALRAADDLDCESLVIPALGCGVAGYDLAGGAALIAGEIRAFEPEHLADVRFVVYDDGEYRTVQEAVSRV